MFVLEIPCRDAAYNQSSLFFAYDERRFPARVNLLYFPQNQGRAKAEIGARAVDTARFSIMEYVKMRGVGDAGYYSRYVVNAITRRVHLVLQIRKDFPDGQDAFHWQGNLDAVPHGAGWVQVWPRPRHR